MKWIATINKIGKQTIEPENEMVLLFGDNVSPDLVEVSVIQKFDQQIPLDNFVFSTGDTITIDKKTYVASYVGSMVENNIKALGHVVLLFTTLNSEKPLANAIYLTSSTSQSLPVFNVDDRIIYEHI
jgi:glucitol/sorbitol PTS system EIIA component